MTQSEPSITAIDHITYLSQEIGPRGSTREGEALAAEYASDILKRLGLEPTVDSFMSAKSIWHPYALFSAIMLVATALFLFGGEIGNMLALILAIACLASVLLELSLRANPLRWILPKAESQNVSVRIRARNVAQHKVVLIGHLDTHRTPIVFSSDTWLKIFGWLIPLGLIASVVLIVLFSLGILQGSDLWQMLALLPAVILIGVFGVTFQADFTPYSPGANDNASGAGVVMSISEELAKNPLPSTEVWILLSGCEEVGCYGADAFVKSKKHKIAGAVWLAVDSIGGQKTSLAYLTKETFLLTTHSDKSLLDIADEVASDNPELKARRHQFTGALTEGAIGGKYGFPVLTLMAVRSDGSVPEWHKSTDTLERIDKSAVTRCQVFLRELLKRIDTS